MPAYEVLNSHADINIVKVKNKMASELQHIVVYFIFQDVNIGEVEIRYGEKAVNYFSS